MWLPAVQVMWQLRMVRQIFVVMSEKHCTPEMPSVLTNAELTYLHTAWRRVLKKLTGSQLAKKFSGFYERRSPLPRLHETATCSYSEPDLSSPCPPYHILKVNLKYSAIYAWFFQVISYPQVSPQKLSCTSSLPIRAMCPTNLILINFITRIIVGEEFARIEGEM